MNYQCYNYKCKSKLCILSTDTVKELDEIFVVVVIVRLQNPQLVGVENGCIQFADSVDLPIPPRVGWMLCTNCICQLLFVK